LTGDPAVRTYSVVVNQHQMVQRYLLAHHGTATVYRAYRAQGSGPAGPSGVRQVLDVTGAKADDFPSSRRTAPGRRSAPALPAHDRKATPAAARAWARATERSGIAWWTVAPPPRRCRPDAWSRNSRCDGAPRGAHLLLQIRTRVLNDTLADDYRRWYPGFARQDQAARVGVSSRTGIGNRA